MNLLQFMQECSTPQKLDHLISYVNAGSFFENPEKAWQELIEEQKARQNGITDQYSLFPQWEGACF